MNEGRPGGLAPFPPKWGGDLHWQVNRPGPQAGREWAGRLQ
jgi:hypothetical protein